MNPDAINNGHSFDREMVRTDIRPNRTSVHKHPYMQYYADEKEAHDYNGGVIDNISDSYEIPVNIELGNYVETRLGDFSSKPYTDEKEAHDYNGGVIDHISDSYDIPVNIELDNYVETRLGDFSSEPYADLATDFPTSNETFQAASPNKP